MEGEQFLPKFEQPKKSRLLKAKIKKSSLVWFLVLILFLFGFFAWSQIYMVRGEGEEVVFKVEKGMGLAEIASQLEKRGLINSEFFFNLAVFGKGVQQRLQAGTYIFSPAMNIAEIVDKLSSGNVAKNRITVVEGWDLNDIALYFEIEGIGPVEEFFEIAKKDFSREFEFLKDKPKTADLEGYLFPDTYEVRNDEDLEAVIKKMLANFGRKLSPELEKEIENQGKTLYQIVTMASLLEKEVKTFEDKQLASGVLWKRLRNGWPLQVDATLSYITGKDTSELANSDKEIDSPYNTYKYYGLPQGPIANPGLESIKAAVFPRENSYWFYLTTPEGKTIFSKTLEEHNYNRWKYLK